MTMDKRIPATKPDLIPAIVSALRDSFNRGVTRSLAYRQQQLAGLMRFMVECEDKISAALYRDLRKSSVEALATEIEFLKSEIKQTQKKLSAWMKPIKVTTPLVVQPGSSYLQPEPLGVVLIIAPWNYPVLLTLHPLLGALAAGNTAVIKPSEMAPAVSQLFAQELPRYLDPAAVTVIEGGVDETTALLNEKFDYIFYTGNGVVGRVVMTAAAKHLTPVTLELGGKSPCIVDHTADLDVTARRLVWAKFTNAGQTCIAPDYVLAEESIVEQLLAKMKTVLHEFYGENPQASPDYGRIINTRHCQRLMALLPGSGEVIVGGKGDEADCYVAPTILYPVPSNAPVMADEIFGPILPVFKIKNIDEAITMINQKPKPLALYLFSNDKQARQAIIEKTSSGSVSVNYPLMQMLVPGLPFGGVGASGMGAYHGKKSYDTFTHYKSVLVKPTWLDLSIMYPPYSESFKRLLRWIM